nr:Spo0E family sporulation regulatory protein-aspartic acid phosphatase [Orenia metallireducens]
MLTLRAKLCAYDLNQADDEELLELSKELDKLILLYLQEQLDINSISTED